MVLASCWSISGEALWMTMACASAISLVARRTPRWIRVIVLLAAVVALGGLRNSLDLGFPDWLIRRAPSIREVTGTVVSYPDVGEASISFTLAPVDMPGDLLVYWPCAQPLGTVHYGDVARVNGSTQLPEVFDGFDYPTYLARRNIFATVFADTVQQVRRPSHSLWNWGDRLRQRLLRRFREIMPPKLAAMAQSLMLGDRSALPLDTEDAFSGTGLMHLLAVSGLHLGIFLGGAWWALRRMGLRPRVTYPLVGMLVLLALVVVGPRVSLVRAGLLFAFLALGSVLADCGVILRRWIHPLNGLAAAAIAILLIRPGAIYDAGFQLTMAATGSILIAFSPSGWATQLSENGRLGIRWRGWQWLIRLLIVSAAAQAGAAPVIAWHFEAFHPLSVLVNLVAVPLAALSLWAGLFSVAFLATPVFAIAAWPFACLLGCLERVVSYLARVPMVELTVIPELGIWLAGCVGFVYLAGFYVWLSSRTSNSTSMESGSPEE
jgi:competence protein ComEC